MIRATTPVRLPHDAVEVGLKVALVSIDHEMRLELVRALDSAPLAWEISLHRTPPEIADVVVCDPALSIEGAVHFDPAAPEGLVEAIVTAARRDAGVVVVTSAGGGAGTTSIALHMAAELVSRGFESALVDMTPDGAAAARMGVSPVGHDTGSDARAVPVQGGFRLVMRDDPDVGRVLEREQRNFERVVADIPGGGLHGLPPGTPAVIVIQPSPIGVHRARVLIEAHENLMWVPVVNRLGPGGEMTAAATGRALGIAVAVELPCCAALRDREDECRLLTPGWTRWTRRIARLVDLTAP